MLCSIAVTCGDEIRDYNRYPKTHPHLSVIQYDTVREVFDVNLNKVVRLVPHDEFGHVVNRERNDTTYTTNTSDNNASLLVPNAFIVADQDCSMVSQSVYSDNDTSFNRFGKSKGSVSTSDQ